MTTTKITIDKHLAEYCIGKWGDDFREPVQFPINSDLYVTIYDLTQKRPEHSPVDSGNIEIYLPNRRKDDENGIRKNPEVYNYLSVRSCKIIKKKIECQFWAELHELLDSEKHLNGLDYIDSIHYFMCKYRIESLSEDAILKNYQRWREMLRKRNKRSYTKKTKKSLCTS